MHEITPKFQKCLFCQNATDELPSVVIGALQWQFEVRINLKPWILSANCTNCYLNKSYLTSQKTKFFRLNGTKAKKRKINVIYAKIINPVSDVQRSRSALLMIFDFMLWLWLIFFEHFIRRLFTFTHTSYCWCILCIFLRISFTR